MWLWKFQYANKFPPNSFSVDFQLHCVYPELGRTTHLYRKRERESVCVSHTLTHEGIVSGKMKTFRVSIYTQTQYKIRCITYMFGIWRKALEIFTHQFQSSLYWPWHHATSSYIVGVGFLCQPRMKIIHSILLQQHDNDNAKRMCAHLWKRVAENGIDNVDIRLYTTWLCHRNRGLCHVCRHFSEKRSKRISKNLFRCVRI